MKKLNLKGQKFGRLTALAEIMNRREPSNGCIRWACKCDCGHYHVVNSNNLRSGAVKSCGCSKRRRYAAI